MALVKGIAKADSLLGTSSDDTLDGGKGADIMTGLAGNDMYVVDNSNDLVVEDLNSGIDSVQSAVSYTLGANVENLTLKGKAKINGTGNELDNVISGNDGNNVLDGGAGTDVLIGGRGNDTYWVDSVADVVTEEVNAGTDTVRSAVTYTLAANVENLILSGTSDIDGTGNVSNNILTGNSGNNVLSGGGGKDKLFSSGGSDTLDGGVDNVKDVYVYNDLSTSNATGGIDHLLNFNGVFQHRAIDKIDVDSVHLKAMMHTVAGASGAKTYVDDTVSLTINSSVTPVNTVDQLYQAIEASSTAIPKNGAAFVNVLGNSALAGQYVLINDATAAVDGHDALIGISGSGTLSGQIFM